MDYYVKVEQDEWAEWHNEVSPWEIKRYLSSSISRSISSMSCHSPSARRLPLRAHDADPPEPDRLVGADRVGIGRHRDRS